MPSLFPQKTALAIATFIAMLAIPEFIPAMKNIKALEWSAVPMVLNFAPKDLPAAAERSVLSPLRDARRNLDGFYEALRKTEQESGAITRILHYGDSPATADLITSDARELFHKHFGDAGHGFHLIGKPWAWYEHRGVRVESRGWTVDPATQSSLNDGVYGLGGVSFRGSRGAYARFRLREAGHNRIELSYLSMPDGGKILLSADGSAVGFVDTQAARQASAYAAISVPEGGRELTIEVKEGHVRLFGVNFERDAAGVVYNSLGLNGAYVSVLAKTFGEEHWASQLLHHRPDLVIVNYGTNESVYADFIEKSYARELKEVIRRIRQAVPKASILVMSPMDRGTREAGGGIGTVPHLPRLVAMQERIAAESGCAFFNTFDAMGGPGTMGRWYRTEPRLVSADFIHPMPAGARIVAGLLFEALDKGYQDYKQRSSAGLRPGIATR